MKLGCFSRPPEPTRKELTKAFIDSISRIVYEKTPTGMMLKTMYDRIDFSKGLVENNARDWSFWFKSGHRLDIAEGQFGGWAVHITERPDTEGEGQ